ncbi:MAG: hypothetical protein JNL30_08335 [Rubrivivax sp.]|nr:hypothetical protein [Rubrivivax sp.]
MITEQSERFEREYGCTDREWLRWMPGATGGRAPELQPGASALEVPLDEGLLRLRWQVLPPRVIALARIPRLAVAFAFEGASLQTRLKFMRHFDLFLQRGGG